MSSEPPNTFHRHHQPPPQRHHLPPLLHGANINITTSSATNTPTSPPVIYREYRKGNWTLEETLVLITAKRLDDQRRSKPNNVDPTTPRHTGELRWKWVENFCWNNGCLRSQNQCNDKWDNLLRDYKKVREYDTKSSQSNLPSYWAMDKQQRKDHNLPSNLTHQIYQQLQDVVQKKSPLKILPPPTPQPPMHHQQPPPPPQPSTVAPAPVVSEASVSSETEWGSHLDPDTKRKRVRDIGSSIVHGASSLARALKRSEEKKEKRHRELMELEEQRIRLDEAQNEAQREGVASLVAAVNNLSSAIQSLAADQRPGS
ncbi:hypothetical protein ACET3Z_002372 [Daucus carota]